MEAVHKVAHIVAVDLLLPRLAQSASLGGDPLGLAGGWVRHLYLACDACVGAILARGGLDDSDRHPGANLGQPQVDRLPGSVHATAALH